MKIYYLSNQNLYTGISIEYKGVPVPWNATDIAPPPHKEGFARQFNRKEMTWAYAPLSDFVPPMPTFEEAKAAKLTEINAVAEVVLSSLTATYPQAELLTFDKQEAEAIAHMADVDTPTPLLSALAAGRGIALDELVQKVIAKANAFTVASGHVIGQRQALEDLLDIAETAEAVQAIVVNINLPSAA